MTRIPFKAALDKCPAMAPATAARCVGSASKTGSRKVDVLVVGAGMVGSSLAAAIGRNPVFSGRSVCVLEAAPKKAYVSPGPGNFSNRVSALNLGTVNFLTKAGAWPLIRQADGGGRCTSFRRMLVWDEAAGSVQTEFLADAAEADGSQDHAGLLGYVVENDVTVEALNKSIDETPNVEIMYGARISECVLPAHRPGTVNKAFMRNKDLPRVTLESGETLEAELLVGADGANSVVRRSMQAGNEGLRPAGGEEVHYFSKDYKQMGVVGTVTFDEEFDNDTAFQRFLSTGPIAYLPVSRTKSSLVWTVPREWAKDMVEMDPEAFALRLNAALQRPPRVPGTILPPHAVRVDGLAAFPLGTGFPCRIVAERTALVGDAAHRIHPMAGQGVNLGFGDADCLVGLLKAGAAAGGHFASYDVLCDYESQRMRHNLSIMGAVDGLHRLYCTDNPLVVAVRTLGVQIFNRSEFLKKIAIATAS